MAVPLRAHHLLCMLSYSGEGYSPAFVHGFNGIVQRLGAGEPMELVTGPDAICAPLCNDACAHCHNASVTQRDRLAADALAPWFERPLVPGARLTLSAQRLAQLRAAFAQDQFHRACAGCPWDGLCADIARNGFAGTLLHMEPVAVPTD